MSLENRKSPWPKRLDRFIGIPMVFAFGLWAIIAKKIVPTKVNRILVIKLSALGDAVLLTPALYEISQKFPDCEIHFLGTGSHQNFTESLPVIKKFYRLKLKTLAHLVTVKFDVIIDFDQWLRTTTLISLFLRSFCTFGFKSKKQFRHYGYGYSLALDTNRHMAENFWLLSMLMCQKILGAGVGDFSQACIRVQHEWGMKAQNTHIYPQLKNKKYIVIHPGCGEQGVYREWPVENWAKLCWQLKRNDPLIEIAITGHGSYEESIANKIPEALSLVNKLSWIELTDTLAKSQVVYASNTGVMHLASYLGTPVIALHGPTNSKLWGPLWKGTAVKSKLACSPCLTWGYDYGCSDPVCVKSITVKTVEGISIA